MVSERIVMVVVVAKAWACRALLALVGAVLMAWGGDGQAAELDPDRLGPQRTAMVAGVIDRLRLRSWNVSVIADEGIPTGWHALSGGIHLRVMAVPPAVDLWVLPIGWMGVRSTVGGRFGLLRCGGLLIVTRPEDANALITQRLSELLPQDDAARERTTSPFPPCSAQQMAIHDAAARELIARFCPDPQSIAAAIDSLLELQIPAPGVFAEAARSPEPAVAVAGITALGELGGAEAIAILLDVLGHEETDRRGMTRQRSAAWALSRIAEPGCGPALLTSLGHLRDRDTVHFVVTALERIDYRPAAGAVLALLEQAVRRRDQGRLAKVLATMRHQPALPLLRRICGADPITGETLARLSLKVADYQPEVALLRLAASWGEPVGGVRLLLVPFARTVVGSGCEIALLIENRDGEERSTIPYLGGSGDTEIVIDGVRHPVAPGGFEGCFTIQQHSTWIDICDLSRLITTPGTYRISYRAGAVSSNEVTVEVSAAGK